MATKRPTSKRPRKKRPWQEVFLGHLATCGNVTVAALKAKVHRVTTYQERAADPGFAAQWDEALAIATELLEAEARRRAEKGILEAVFYKGEKCGTVRKYSDTLLIFLLKAHDPKFREASRVQVSGDPAGAPVKHELSGTVEHKHELDQAAFRSFMDGVLGAGVRAVPADGDGEPVG